MEWLAALLVLPSLVAAECKDPRVTHVSVQLPNVSWEGALDPACLQGFHVCWSLHGDPAEACESLPPAASSLLVNEVRPCAYLYVRVTAVGRSGLNSSTAVSSGLADPPKLRQLRSTQPSRDALVLQWASLANYSCVEHVKLWLCPNRTQDRGSCFFTQLYEDVTQLELYDFPACRHYHVYACAQHTEACPLTVMRVYLDSANELTRVEAANVTQDSAVIKWWVSDVNFTCRTEKVQLCYQEKGNDTSAECWSWVLDQAEPGDSTQLTDLYSCAAYSAVVSLATAVKTTRKTVTFTTPMAGDAIDAGVGNVSDTAAVIAWSFGADRTDCRPDSMQVCYWPVGDSDSRLCRSLGTAAHSSARLHNLEACSSYRAELTLLTTASPQPSTALELTTTSAGHPVMVAMSATATKDLVRVEWTPADSSLQCVRLYNVSWYSSGDPRRTWQSLPTDTTSYTIHAVSSGQTYYVQVSAVFLDGTSESLSRHVDVPAHSGCSSSYDTVSCVQLVTTILSLRYFLCK
ncbi:uncharacterized protein LOC134536514 [Bacillus rossius redtenbacheri]|uniref:uncharacterized protein LOC134536514 n=1 Tax=Bacillus rossius redtenbacheri TaxID=93214 RepID=UPI002FDD648A